MAKTKLTDQIIYEIYNSKENIHDIAKKYNVSESTVRRIKKLEYKKYAEAIARISGKKIKKVEEIKKENKENKEIEFKEINKDQFAGILFGILTKYVQPEIAKFIIDNYIMSEKVENLINGLINKINETKDINFYKESLVTMTTLLLQKILQPKYLLKIFDEKDNNDKSKSTGIEKT